MKRQNLVLLFATSLIGLLLWILGSTPRASAVPTFSRKYQTSFTTCHSNFHSVATPSEHGDNS